MTTAHPVHFSATLRRAEYLTAQGQWHPLAPDPADPGQHPWPPQDQPIADDGSITIRPGRCYRATPSRLSPCPPFPSGTRPPIHWHPSGLALELGLHVSWDGIGSIYISAATSTAVHIQKGAHLISAHLLYTPADASAGAAAALRRAHMVTPAEQVVAAGERGPDILARVLGDIRAAAPEWIAAMPRQPEGQLHPARDLLWILDCARAVALGKQLPEREGTP